MIRTKSISKRLREWVIVFRGTITLAKYQIVTQNGGPLSDVLELNGQQPPLTWGTPPSPNPNTHLALTLLAITVQDFEFAKKFAQRVHNSFFGSLPKNAEWAVTDGELLAFLWHDEEARQELQKLSFRE